LELLVCGHSDTLCSLLGNALCWSAALCWS